MLQESPPPAPLVRAIVDALPNPLLVIDERDRICFVNGAAENFFKTSSALLTRHKISDLVPFSSPLLHAVAKARSTAGIVYEYNMSVGSPRFGGERSVDVQAVSVPDDPEFITITLLEHSNAHRIDRQLTVGNAARSVTGMAAMLAHEIKNPLAGIRGAAQLLEPALAETDRALARLICDETDRIRELVDQMEVFSDERPIECGPVNIHEVLARVKNLTLAALPSAITIAETYDPSLPPVLGNKDQLVQVFLNLARNAAEALETGGGEINFTTAFRPGIRLSRTEGAGAARGGVPLEVCVHDTGPGVPEELRASIFDPFVTTKPAGRGLGLALVAKIVRDLGGTVECLRRERGTTFRVLLPMCRQADGDAA